jgi:nucleoside-diphosphate-sugar epimerase
MQVVVTGAAGFVGSHLAEALVARGDEVLGIDCFTDYYPAEQKWDNLAALGHSPHFALVTSDLRSADLAGLFAGADVIFHQAGQPGVRPSWSSGFADYCGHNILATQRVLEAARAAGTARVVYASSSSVYGNAPYYPTAESDLPRPHSPYGVTKLAAEHLCSLYAHNWSLSTVSLRYFTVYGPRQRPDMAMRRLVDAAFTGATFPLYGTGLQIRDFTYVDDVVRANLLAAEADLAPGSVINIAGGSNARMSEVIALVAELSGRPIRKEQLHHQAGDVDRTGGTVDLAAQLLGWAPAVPLRSGLSVMVEWARQRHAWGASAPGDTALIGADGAPAGIAP